MSMPKTPGVARRRAGRPTGLLQAHVDLDVRERARQVADAAGISVTLYLEALIRRDELDDTGRPLWWRELPRRNDSDEELPLTG